MNETTANLAGDERAKMIEKIRKLFALSESANEHEAMLAHVANTLKLPEPGKEEEEQGGEHEQEAEPGGKGAQPAYE